MDHYHLNLQLHSSLWRFIASFSSSLSGLQLYCCISLSPLTCFSTQSRELFLSEKALKTLSILSTQHQMANRPSSCPQVVKHNPVTAGLRNDTCVPVDIRSNLISELDSYKFGILVNKMLN